MADGERGSVASGEQPQGVSPREAAGGERPTPLAHEPAPAHALTFDQALFTWLGSRDGMRQLEQHAAGTIAKELEEGFDALAGVERAITFFGSSRTPAGHPLYERVRELCAHIAGAGYAVMTGGGPGLMEAANRGARDGGSLSIGCNLEFPIREIPNEHLDLLLRFKHFFARKVMFLRYASAYVIAPGGYGTLDELFEALTLIQTETVRSCPVIVLGGEEWDALRSWLERYPLADGRIGAGDLDLIQLVARPQEALEILERAATLARGG
ncbi:MAG: LOG family protein [Solirubrobacteraceae bacterium]